MECDLCCEDQDLFDYIYKNNKDKYILRLSAGWNDDAYDFDYAEIEVKYCPKCGRKLV